MSSNNKQSQPFMPDHAFILAAGKGTRLRPYTDELPKPLVRVNKRPILDYILEKLTNENITNITVNLNYLGDRIKNHLENVTNLNITFSEEIELLETGGGVKKALPTLGNKPFFMINGDALWTDKSDQTALQKLAYCWDDDKMDILLLLQPIGEMSLTHGVGDYDMNKNGQATRSKDKTGTYMFGGIRITKPDIIAKHPENIFSYRDLMDAAEAKGRLYGVTHDGDWHHISTPEDLDAVNKALYDEITRTES